jgi:pimeloyl-ACP methyl ester carboxylesterase
MTNISSGMAEVDGAKLYYEVRGRGPALLMISGAGGDAGYYSQAAAMLEDSFTVITYDRRGNSRSTGGNDAPFSIAEQARDAKSLIDEFADGRAVVFGNSGGAIIGLALAAAFPAVVEGLIAHEPPIVGVLPADAEDRDFFTQILAVAETEGIPAAASRFVESIRGEGSYEWPAEILERFLGNIGHLFTNEFGRFGEFIPDWDALTSGGVPIVMAAGNEDRGLFYATPSIIIAERIGTPWIEFPGNHLPFIERPREFAAALRVVATQIVSRTGGVPQNWMAP